MLKRFLPIAGALALMIGIGTGCQDSQVSAPQNDDATLPAGGSSVTFPSADDDFDGNVDLIASFDDVMNGAPLLAPPATGPNNDTARGGKGGRGGRGHGDKDTTRGGGRDTTKGGRGDDTVRGGDDGGRGDGPKRPPCLQDGYLKRLLANIRLTPEQAAAVRACQQDLKECVDAATRRYHEARKALFAELRAELNKIQQAVKNGRITPAEGRRLWNAVKETYRKKFADLHARYIAALEHCCDEFNLCIRQALGGGRDGEG